MPKYKADIRADFSVEFEDNGEDSIVDQAHDAGEAVIGHIDQSFDISVVGMPEEVK